MADVDAVDVVVRIPKIEYEHLTNEEKFHSLEKSKQEWLINKTLNRIADGIQLSEGHGDLIDVSDIRVIELEDSLHIIEHKKGDEVRVYIEAPVVIKADETNNERKDQAIDLVEPEEDMER